MTLYGLLKWLKALWESPLSLILALKAIGIARLAAIAVDVDVQVEDDYEYKRKHQRNIPKILLLASIQIVCRDIPL